jgi:hypothetical protein
VFGIDRDAYLSGKFMRIMLGDCRNMCPNAKGAFDTWILLEAWKGKVLNHIYRAFFNIIQ